MRVYFKDSLDNYQNFAKNSSDIKLHFWAPGRTTHKLTDLFEKSKSRLTERTSSKLLPQINITSRITFNHWFKAAKVAVKNILIEFTLNQKHILFPPFHW